MYISWLQKLFDKFISGTLQFTPRGLKPVFNISVGNHLGKNTMGYLTFSSNWTAKEVHDVRTVIFFIKQFIADSNMD